MFTVRQVDGIIDITEAGNIPTQKALNQPKEGLRHKTGFFSSLLTPRSPMASVRFLRIHPIELTHPFGQVRFWCFHYKVLVVRHQAVRMAQPIEPFRHLCQYLQEGQAVFVIRKNRLLTITTRGHVIKRSGKLYAKGSGHAGGIYYSD